MGFWAKVLVVLGAAGAAAAAGTFLGRNATTNPDVAPRLREATTQWPQGPTSTFPAAQAGPLPRVPDPALTQKSVAPLVQAVEGAVVAIHTARVIHPVVEDPFRQWMRYRLGLSGGQKDQRPRQEQLGQGSGFIVDALGTVLTNNHVVAGADLVTVILDDGREFEAQVLGSDPTTDVAVLRMQSPPGDLTPARLGDSDAVEVGDYVLAIGNPLGLGKTVTMGIVSAKNRSLGKALGDVPARYQAFIQTDAAINQGNSGGPLFNFSGQVVGVNSAILNPAVAMNVGFAIPINLARAVAQQLESRGLVERGFLGVRSESLTPERAAQLGVSQASGAYVLSVVPGSPAETAGIRSGDVIEAIAGKALDRPNALAQVVATLAPGSRVPIVLHRGSKRVTTEAQMGARASGVELKAMRIVVAPLPAREGRDLGLSTGEGVRVVFVDPRGPVSGSLQEDDVVISVGRESATVKTMQAFERALLRGGWGRLVLIRDGKRMQVTLSG